MDKLELLKEISSTLAKTKVVKLAAISSENSFSVSNLLELTFYPTPEIAFRSAWIPEHIQQANPRMFLPLTVKFLNRYPQQKNQRCRRHFTKFMMFLTDPKHSRDKRILEGYNMEPVVEITFE